MFCNERLVTLAGKLFFLCVKAWMFFIIVARIIQLGTKPKTNFPPHRIYVYLSIPHFVQSFVESPHQLFSFFGGEGGGGVDPLYYWQVAIQGQICRVLT